MSKNEKCSVQTQHDELAALLDKWSKTPGIDILDALHVLGVEAGMLVSEAQDAHVAYRALTESMASGMGIQTAADILQGVLRTSSPVPDTKKH